MSKNIVIKGAREHNLKNIDLEIPRDKLVVFTGLSGSGKSSLAFDTIYAEGQRRYVESLSAYARQFLGQMDKPDVDYIEGLSPAISIDQKTTSRNPRSTVGTVTEIYDYLRLLYARVGIPHCPVCGRVIKQQTVDEMIQRITELPEGTRFQVMAPVVRGRKGEFGRLFSTLQKDGYVRVRVDGEMYDLADEIRLDKQKKHKVEVVVDRLSVKDEMRSRLNDSLETALKLAEGLVLIDVVGGQEMLFSSNYACPDCGISIAELTPRMFSFNNPYGACPTCSGLGTLMKIDPKLVIPNDRLSLYDGCVHASGWASSGADGMTGMFWRALSKEYQFDIHTPWRDLPEKIRQMILYGAGDKKITVEYNKEYGSGTYQTTYEGLIPSLERRYRETKSPGMKEYYESLMGMTPCPDCKGERLRPEALAVTVGGLSISAVSSKSVVEARDFFTSLELTRNQRLIADQILKEINSRLSFLADVGLEYLTLSRAAASLSGGEAQRIRLATQIGSQLVGVLYILDEPSIGLHQRDNARLIQTLKKLRDLGNTLIVVEHDEETMQAADYIVDIGPGPGVHGGEVIAAGTYDEICANEASITGQYLSGRKKIAVPEKRRKAKKGQWLTIYNARENNLKGVDVKIPLGVFTCVTGVSGSGKSSLVNEILQKTLARDLNRARTQPGLYDRMEGVDKLDKVISIDQSPIGRTPRSNPATYTGVFDLIRKLFAQTPDARMRGYDAGRFSFNVKGGRCEACSGDGLIKIEMHFLSDVYVPCEVCGGKRYNRETLEVKYKGKNIFEVLDVTVEEAVDFFEPVPAIYQKIKTLRDVGLGYIKLGQPSTELSGGEAQRVKLATELARRDTGRTLYILDEPTTGLHTDDVNKLVSILQQLVESGNSAVVIEHNLDVIKTADYIIDLGPEGGDRGGEIIASGTPEQVAQVPGSYTGQYLQKVL
ncbi:MAG: excinuclease ABC subunit UvrA [Eubacteriales bacterium]|nr:excinuclease ABC subunit UvrA [Eubacteriales bacterium]